MNPSSPSKLFIRSEVLAVIESLAAPESLGTPLPKQDKLKQVKRLGNIPDQATVQKLLIKELQRVGEGPYLHVITELLMELGTIELVQEPLWQLISQADTSDEVKDAANLILRHLGDDSDPNLYLDFLEDPEGLITRETQRMLEVSAQNPEALIDFLDFIFSLPVDEQLNLLDSLQHDYNPEHLVNLYIPGLLANPPDSIKELLLGQLGQTRSKRAAQFLNTMGALYEADPRLSKLVKKAINELRLAGVYRDETPTTAPDPCHPLTQSSQLHLCFATLPDGIGNQGIVISRQQTNGDIAMMSVAINDLHGVIDCFGFYQLSQQDFNKLTDKFHEHSSKVKAPAEYCLAKLHAAEKLNLNHQFRIPYEYTCWKILLEDIQANPMDLIKFAHQEAQDIPDSWGQESANLYHHPDFSTWFLEEGDHPVINDVLSKLQRNFSDQATIEDMEALAELIIRGLMATHWRALLMHRLADVAFLLQQQQAHTFSKLAAAEVIKLSQYTDTMPLSGFIRQYGRRCIEEYLLKLKQETPLSDTQQAFVDQVLTAWEV